jgi:hypothetical protein
MNGKSSLIKDELGLRIMHKYLEIDTLELL